MIGYGGWAVRDKATQTYLGGMGWLLAPQAQGKGYAQEALEAIIQRDHQHLAGKTG